MNANRSFKRSLEPRKAFVAELLFEETKSKMDIKSAKDKNTHSG